MKTTPLHQRLETPTETDTQEHVYQKPVRDVNELKQHVTDMVNNEQSSIDQTIDQWQDCFNGCLKVKSKN